MSRNIEKQIKIAKEILLDNRGYDLTVDEIQQIISGNKRDNISLDSIWDIISNSFYTGIAIGARIERNHNLKMKKAGETLRTLRGSRPLAEVAQEINVSIAALRDYESGSRTPRDSVKLRLSEYYGKDITSIFCN